LSSASVIYNFNNLYKKPKVLQPYIGLGIGFFNFDSKTDLKDANGNYYNYWSDGSIRNKSETASGAELAKPITRDYTYETDLRSLNSEGRGKYSTLALSVPIEFGALFRVSSRVSFKLGATYYYNFTNLVDNVTERGKGVLKGTKGPDNFLFTSFNVSFNLFKEEKKEKQMFFDNMPDSLFSDIDTKDSDGDGVPDFIDECAGTPKGALITKNGCPLDDDKDGIENFRDEEEKSTVPLPPVTVDGRNFTDEIILAQLSKDSVGFQRDLIERAFANQIRLYGYPVKNFRQSLVDSITRGIALNPLMDSKIDSLFNAIDKDYDRRQVKEKEQIAAINSGKVVDIPILSSSQKAIEKADEAAKQAQVEVNSTNEDLKNGAKPKISNVKPNPNEVVEDITTPDLLSAEERKAIEKIVNKNSEKNLPQGSTVSKTEVSNQVKSNTQQSSGLGADVSKTNTVALTDNSKSIEGANSASNSKPNDNKSKENTSTVNKSNGTGKSAKGADLYPQEYKDFDFNSDGMLTGDEILKAIDMFTDGLLKISSEKLFDMIEFYNSKMKNAKVIDYGVSKGIYIDGVLKIVKKEMVEDQTSQKKKLPERFRKVDMNNDGNITSQEVDEIIKRHKAGNKLYSKEFTNDLIDWFFGD
jgi:hypothetical protein